LTSAGITPLIADVSNREDLDKLPLPFDWVVNTVSSSKGGIEDYKQVYLQGARNLIDWLSQNPPKKFVYTSSTSVYGQDDGSWVREDSAAQPASETSRVLLETENVVLQAARENKFPAVVLRVSGIYGPERGHAFRQFLKGAAQMSGSGQRFMNMIHLDDVVGAIIAALERGRPGEIYNASDDEPVTQLHFYRWLVEVLALDMPPFADEGADRKRGLTSKRVSNRRLKMELGCQLKYPTFRDGYTAEIARLEHEGAL
jgi:nucleoside-diphosphate-sugar epimerase